MDISRVALAVDSSQVNRARTNLLSMQAAGQRAEKSMVALGASIAALAGVGVGLKSSVDVIANYDKALRGLQAVSKATTSQMAALEKQSRQLGATSAFSATQAANAQEFLARAGFNVNEVLSSTPGILNLAIAGQLDLARAADIASNVLGGFRLEVDQINRVNDVLAATAAGANTNIEQLGDALSYAAPIAASAGVSIEEAAAAIGALGDAGLQGSRGGTGLLGVIRQLSNLTPKATAALEQYGLSAEQVNVETRGLTDVLHTLRNANLSAADALIVFGSEAGPAGQILANSAEKVSQFTKELENADGALQSMADIMGGGVAMAFKELQSAAEEAILVIGRDLGAGGQLEDAIRGTAEIVRALGENMDVVVKSATILATFMAGRYVASMTSAAVASFQLARGVSAATIAIRGASAALAVFGGPVGIAVTALGTAATLLWDFGDAKDDAARASKDHKNALDQENKSLMDQKNAIGNTQLAFRERALQSAQDRIEALRALQASQEILGELSASDRFSFGDTTITGLELMQQGGVENAIQDQIKWIEQLKNEIASLKANTQDAPIISPQKNNEIKSSVDKFAKSLQSLMDELDPLGKITREYQQDVDLLDEALTKGKITATQKASALALLKQRYNEQSQPLASMVRSLQEERSLMMLSNDERQIELSLRQRVDELRRNGYMLKQNELMALRQEIELNQKLGQFKQKTAEEQAQGGMFRNIGSGIGGQPSGAFSGLVQTQGALGELNQSESMGIQETQEIMALRLREAEKISMVEDRIAAIEEIERDGAERITQIQMEAAEKRDEIMKAQNMVLLSGAETVFGDLATIAKGFAGEQSGIYKAMFAVSKAFSIAQSLVAIQSGMAQALNAPYPMNLIGVANVAAAGASIVSSLTSIQAQGFANGGFVTGPGGPRSDSIPARLSDGEFVVNAKATKQNRGMLEAMNSGKDVSGMGGGRVNVTVKNYAGVEMDVQQLSENDVVVIARRVAKQEIRKDAPQVFSAELTNPNSRTSRALSQNTNTQRKR